VIVERVSDEMGTLALPPTVAGLDVGYSQVEKAAETIRVRVRTGGSGPEFSKTPIAGVRN